MLLLLLFYYGCLSHTLQGGGSLFSTASATPCKSGHTARTTSLSVMTPTVRIIQEMQGECPLLLHPASPEASVHDEIDEVQLPANFLGWNMMTGAEDATADGIYFWAD